MGTFPNAKPLRLLISMLLTRFLRSMTKLRCDVMMRQSIWAVRPCIRDKTKAPEVVIPHRSGLRS